MFRMKGDIYMEKAALEAINRMQAAFAGEAERLELENEDDVAAMVREIRKERWEKKYAGAGCHERKQQRKRTNSS